MLWDLLSCKISTLRLRSVHPRKISTMKDFYLTLQRQRMNIWERRSIWSERSWSLHRMSVDVMRDRLKSLRKRLSFKIKIIKQFQELLMKLIIELLPFKQNMKKKKIDFKVKFRSFRSNWRKLIQWLKLKIRQHRKMKKEKLLKMMPTFQIQSSFWREDCIKLLKPIKKRENWWISM